MTIDKAVRIFAEFLNKSWFVSAKLLTRRAYTSDEQSIHDWLQASWEVLVERKVLKLGDYLEVYGEGADYNGVSSRMTDVDAKPNFKVIVKPKNGIEIFDILSNETFIAHNVSFDKIVGFANGWYKLEPDFKYALLIDNDLDIERVVDFESIEFYLNKIE